MILKQGGVSHCGLAIHIKKYLKAKEEYIWKPKYFTMKKIQSSENSLKETKINPSRYYNSITNLKFQHKPKYISSFKNPHIKIDLLLLPRGKNPLSYYSILYNESKHNILALGGKANKTTLLSYV
jgi:hypothetical protein